MGKFGRFLQSPANWCGLALSSVALVLSALGLTRWGGTVLAALGYAVGFCMAGLWLGFPKLSGDAWDALNFAPQDEQGDMHSRMAHALDAVRQLADNNPGGRLPASLRSKVLSLCQQLYALLEQWERSKGELSLDDSFYAQHIATSYLPDALKTYLSIPQQFAMTKVLSNGKTAQETFNATLDDLSRKVSQLGEALSAQDAQAFLNHSRFLQEEFKASPHANAQIQAQANTLHNQAR